MLAIILDGFRIGDTTMNKTRAWNLEGWETCKQSWYRMCLRCTEHWRSTEESVLEGVMKCFHQGVVTFELSEESGCL